MPMYTYACDRCGTQVDLIQPHDAQRPPSEEEAGAAPCADEKPHTWTKVIHAPNIAKGAGWGGGKGNW